MYSFTNIPAWMVQPKLVINQLYWSRVPQRSRVAAHKARITDIESVFFLHSKKITAHYVLSVHMYSGAMGKRKGKRTDLNQERRVTGFVFPQLIAQHHQPRPLQEICAGVLTSDSFLTKDECIRLSTACIPFLEPTNPKNVQPKKGFAFRNNDRFLMRDEAFAEALFSRMESVTSRLLPAACGVNPDFRFYRYVKGARFDAHIDESVHQPDGSYSEYTVLMYLTADNLRGGATTFHSRPPVSVDPKPGRMYCDQLLHFTSAKHSLCLS